MTMDQSTHSWFCSDVSNSLATDLDFIKNGYECDINLANFFLHLTFVIISIIVLSCCVFTGQCLSYSTRWPGHVFRWIITCLLLLCALASITEGILTSTIRYEKIYHQFYLPGTMLFIAITVSLLFYRFVERYHAPRLCWLLVLYWVFCVILNGWRISYLVREDVTIDAAVFWITIVKIALFIALLLLELYLICSQVLIVMYSAKVLDTDATNVNMKYREDYVSLFHYVTFWWMNWLFWLGFKRPLEIEDLGTLPNIHRAQHLYEIFKEEFQKEVNRKMTNSGSYSVWKVFWRVYKSDILKDALNRLVYDIASLIGPLALSGVVVYVIAYNEPKQVDAHSFVTLNEFFSNGYVLVAVIFLTNIVQELTFQQNQYMSNITGIHIRTSLQTMVYDKALRLSSYTISGGSMTVGQITNHMSVDAYNMFFFSQRMQYLWSVPFRIIAVIGLLYLQVEVVAFLALATIVLAITIQLFNSHVQSIIQKSVMIYSDERLKQSNEMLLGIKLLKMYGWEEMFCKAIEAVRKLEMSSIFKFNACYGFNICILQVSLVVVNLVVYVSYPYITGKTLEPNTTFAALAFINLLDEPLYNVPLLNSLVVNAVIGARRLQVFLMAPEMERSHEIPWNNFFKKEKKGVHNATEVTEVTVDEKTPLLRKTSYGSIGTTEIVESYEINQGVEPQLTPAKGIYDQDMFAFQIEKGDFTWGNSTSEPVLRGINLEIPHGELTMIIGPVGSGKSSLLSAILGEMTTLRGSVKFGTHVNIENASPSVGIAYGSQKAWLMNATLRDNVLFGMPFNQSRYRKVIEACALKPDIDILPGGDMTEIGEKGINLSGGQKQRVSVARTMYSDKPIVLLDDPLSALDVNVGGHLFQNGIIGRLRKANRTVVLVTHQLQYLKEAEKIVIMKKGQIHFQGNFDEIANADPDIYRKWQQDVLATTDESEAHVTSSEESTFEERDNLMKQVQLLRNRTASQSKADTSNMKEKDSEHGKLIENEDLARGSVAANTYWYYIVNMGLFWAFITPVGRLALEVGNAARNFWLSYWAEAGLDENRTMTSINDEYVGPFVGISFACMFTIVIFTWALAVSTWNAARAIHLKMLRNITRSPIRFFDTTPIGRILNRLSSDTQIIDSKLCVTLASLFHFMFGFLAAIIVNVVIAPIFVAEIIPVIVAYVILGIFFLRTSRELQRLDSVTRSPIFAHFSETLGGLTTIRSYREQQHFFNTLLKRIDTNNSTFQYLQAAYSWLGLQMSLCGGLMVLMVGLTSTLLATVSGNLDSTIVGLALSYVLLISNKLTNTIRYAGDLEMQLNPVERVQFYANTPTENYEGKAPPKGWPERGQIIIDNVSVRYANTLPPVLRNIYLYVKPGEKVGICGRTGSGKSSLTLSLLRLIDTFKGKIIIDGEDIAQMPLTTLRQRLSIIPQDPILFTGTIRSNLDPLDHKSDDELWKALEIAQLKPIVSGFELGLDTPVSEGGENFSVGQRQLFCLARAFLRNSRVLIMDEATASIDYATEKLLQEVVASVFEDKTVLTIAHRVSTILESDTIWVLQDGEVIEYDSPERLMERQNSVFRSMVQANK